MIANMKQRIDKLLHRQSHEEEQTGAFAHKLGGVKWANSESEVDVNSQVPPATASDPLADAAYRARPGNPFSEDF